MVSVRGVIARAALVGIGATLLVPVGQVEVWATPLTLSETIQELEPVDDAGFSLAEAADDGEEVQRSRPLEAPLTFSAVGFEAPVSASALRVRTSLDGGDWSAWDEVAFVSALDGPDAGTPEARAEESGHHTDPLWVGEADRLQVELVGADVTDVSVTVIDSMGHSGGPVQRQVDTQLGTPAEASGLEIISRAQWGADESLGSSKVSIADDVHMGVVHHTAHASGARANSYSEAEAAGLVRAMHRYHTASLGWSDIGYNVLIDRFGNVYEGRKGGFQRGVIGAHAAGFNTGSFGVSVIGNFYDTQASAAAIRSLTEVLGVKAAMHGIDPTGFTSKVGDGRLRPTIVGHRDVGQTSCPGRIAELLPQLRQNAAGINPSAYESVRFPDVPTTSPHRNAILELADAGVTSGCGANTYCPRDVLNRGQASSFVVTALELDPIPGSRFPDVPAGALHAERINVLARNGWLIGYEDGNFRPWEKMTRGQLATLLARSLGLPLERPAEDPYVDVDRDSVHAPGIAALKAEGIRGNCGGGKFCADDPVLRDSTASFVHAVRQLRN